MQFMTFIAARADTGAALPFARVTVYVADNPTLAVLFDKTGAGLANPFNADASGVAGLAAADGRYDVLIQSADGAYSAPLIHSLQLVDLAEAVATTQAAAISADAAARRAMGRSADVDFQQAFTATDASGMQVVVGAIDQAGDQYDAGGNNLSESARQFTQVASDGALLMQDEAGLPLFAQDADGGLVPIGDTVSLQLQLSHLRGQQRGGGETGRYRLYTFADVRDANGNEAEYLMAFDGDDGASFPSRRWVTIDGMPAGTTVRDPSVFRDTAGIWWLTYSSHGFAIGAADASFGIASSRDGVEFTYVASVALPGMQEAWAPDWTLDALGRAHIVVATAPGAGVAHAQHVLRASAPDMTIFTDLGPLSGAALPPDTIDAHIVYEDGWYIAVIKSETIDATGHSLRLSWADAITGPYDVPIDLAFIVGIVEGPYLLRLPEGRLRLFYDRVGGTTPAAPLGYQYIDTTAPVGAALASASAWTAEQPVMAGSARHGCVLPI